VTSSYLKKILILVLFQLISACSHVLKVPTNRTSLPESNGAGMAKVGLHYLGASKMETATGMKDETVVAADDAKKGNVMLFLGAVSPLPSLDLEYALGGDTPMYIGAKWQIFGDPVSQAKAGNISFALRGGYAVGFYGGTIPPEEINSNQERQERKYVYTGLYSNMEALIGYRILDFFIVYGGYYKNKYAALVEFTQGIKDQLRSKGDQTGYHLGVSANLLGFVGYLNYSKFENQMVTAPVNLKGSSIGLGFDFIF
jgi:hypothetical protein